MFFGCLFTVTQLGWVHKYKMSLSENISPPENWFLDPQEASRRWQTISKMLSSASTCHQTWARRQTRDNEYICIENEATWSYFTAVLRELKKEFASFKLKKKKRNRNIFFFYFVTCWSMIRSLLHKLVEYHPIIHWTGICWSTDAPSAGSLCRHWSVIVIVRRRTLTFDTKNRPPRLLSRPPPCIKARHMFWIMAGMSQCTQTLVKTSEWFIDYFPPATNYGG